MDAARERFAAKGCSVLIVSQARPEVLARYLSRFAWRVPLVCDPERAAYRAFGLERTGRLTFFRPRVLWGYLREVLRGAPVRRPYAGEDVLQLGGDFVVARAGRVVFAFRSRDPTARPAVAELLAALPSARPIGPACPPDAPRSFAPHGGQ